MSARPGRIIRTIPVTLARPRSIASLTSAEFMSYKARIMADMKVSAIRFSVLIPGLEVVPMAQIRVFPTMLSVSSPPLPLARENGFPCNLAVNVENWQFDPADAATIVTSPLAARRYRTYRLSLSRLRAWRAGLPPMHPQGVWCRVSRPRRFQRGVNMPIQSRDCHKRVTPAGSSSATGCIRNDQPCRGR